MARQAIIAPLGIITRPNQYGQYPPGACSDSLNVCYRAPGIAEGFNEVSDLITSAGGSQNNVIRKIFPGQAQYDAVGATSVMYALQDTNTGGWDLMINTTQLTAPRSGAEPAFGYSCQGSYVRNRWILSDVSNPLVVDSVASTATRWAGLAAPRVISFGGYSTAAAASVFANNYGASYRAHFERTVTYSGAAPYVITGAVSPATTWDNTSGVTADPNMVVYWPDDHGIVAGTVVKLYRTPTQPVGTDPGDTFYLVAQATLAAGDITAGYVTISDHAPDSALGAELYTNPYQKGLAKSYQIPPGCRDIVTFKGSTFYGAIQLGAALQSTVPGASGTLTTVADRTYGIGRRTDVGTTGIGTKVIAMASTLGIVPGQLLTCADFPAPTYVVSVVTNVSVTVDQNATATTGGVTVTFDDRIAIGSAAAEQVLVCSQPMRVLDTPSKVCGILITPDRALKDAAAPQYGVSMRFTAPHQISGIPYLRATNGQNYYPVLPALTGTPTIPDWDYKYNLLIYSETDQPEACPEGNELLIGSGTHYRYVTTRDAMWVFASDGLWRVSGEMDNWRVDLVDGTLKLSAVNAVDVMRDVIYAYTNRGIVAISDARGIEELTTGIIDDVIAPMEWSTAATTFLTFLTCDLAHNEVWVTFGADESVIRSSYVFNTVTRAWTRFSNAGIFTATGYSQKLGALLYGSGGYASGSNPYPDLVKFLNTTARTNIDGPMIAFQPIYGTDPAGLQQWIDVTAIFGNVGSGNLIYVYPAWDGTQYSAQEATGKPGSATSGLSSELRVTFGVPRNQAVAPLLRCGWRIISGESQAWQFRGLSVRYEPIAEESLR